MNRSACDGGSYAEQRLSCHSIDCAVLSDGMLTMDEQAESACTSTVEEQPSVCAVCSDNRDIGLHYGIPSCFGCKAFFRRTIKEEKAYVCAKEGKCVVDKKCRNQCRACRFKMCIARGMLLTEVREDRKDRGIAKQRPKKKAIKPLCEEATAASPLLFPQSNTCAGTPDFINFLIRVDQSLEHLYDPAYEHISAEDTVRLNELYGRQLTLEEGLQRPDHLCPRTKLRWDCERVYNVCDLTFLWYRGFVAVADWASGIPQFRQLDMTDKAQLFRLNFVATSFMMFLQYSALEIGFAMGNGAYMPHDGENITELMDTVNYRYKMEIFPPLIRLNVDQREIGVLKAILFFNGDATLSAEGQRACESVVSSTIEAWFEYQKIKYPGMSTIEVVNRQSQILLVLPKIMHVWQSEHDAYLINSVFHGLNLDGIPMELISNKGLQRKQLK